MLNERRREKMSFVNSRFLHVGYSTRLNLVKEKNPTRIDVEGKDRVGVIRVVTYLLHGSGSGDEGKR